MTGNRAASEAQRRRWRNMTPEARAELLAKINAGRIAGQAKPGGKRPKRDLTPDPNYKPKGRKK